MASVHHRLSSPELSSSPEELSLGGRSQHIRSSMESSTSIIVPRKYNLGLLKIIVKMHLLTNVYCNGVTQRIHLLEAPGGTKEDLLYVLHFIHSSRCTWWLVR